MAVQDLLWLRLVSFGARAAEGGTGGGAGRTLDAGAVGAQRAWPGAGQWGRAEV